MTPSSLLTQPSTPAKPLFNKEDWHSHDGDRDTRQAWRYAQCSLLVAVGLLGTVCNSAVAAAMLLSRRLRRTSNAFQLHQCLLDLLKSAYCIIYANSIMADREPPYCNLLGGSFIVCATSAAFNLLAMVMSESYAFADLAAGLIDSGNCCCVLFGIGTVWFASFILNLGVALLPGNPSYMEQIGHCTFRYGEMRNYVLHALWVFVVTAAVVLTAMYLRRLHADIISSGQRCGSDLRRTVRRLACEDPNVESELLRRVERYALSRMRGLLALTAAFVLLWYPLFALTLVDAGFKSQPAAYKGLTMLACVTCAANPLLLACLCRARPPAAFAASASAAAAEAPAVKPPTVRWRKQRPLIEAGAHTGSRLSMPQLSAPPRTAFFQRRSEECLGLEEIAEWQHQPPPPPPMLPPPPQSSSWSPPESPILGGRLQTTL